MSDKDEPPKGPPFAGTVMIDEGDVSTDVSKEDDAPKPAFAGTVFMDDTPGDTAEKGPNGVPEDAPAAFGGTMFISDDEPPPAEGLGGTVVVPDAPAVGMDGTVVASESDESPMGGTMIVDSGGGTRRSKPPPLPGQLKVTASTAMPPDLPVTDQPPELTLERSGTGQGGGMTQTDASETRPPVIPQATPRPAPVVQPAPVVAVTTARAATGATTSGSGATTGARAATGSTTGARGATPAGAATPGQPQVVAAAAAPRKKGVPLWAQLLVLIVLAGVVGRLIAYLQAAEQQPVASATPPKPQPPPPKPAASNPAPTPSPAPAPTPTPPAPASVEPAPPPVAPAPPAPAMELGACVAQEIPEINLPAAELQFLCEETDANRAQRSLGSLFAARGVSGDARGGWQTLGWYRMARAQVIRSRCCAGAPPLALSAALAGCKMDAALAAIDEAVRKSTPLEDVLGPYYTSVDCLFKANASKSFGMASMEASPPMRSAFLKQSTR